MSQVKLKNNAQNDVKSALKKENRPAQTVTIPVEQIKYANLLLYGAWSGIAMLAMSFIAYMLGLTKPFVEPSKMPDYWGMKVTDYVAQTGAPTGWQWFSMVGHGDYMNMLGIAFLAGLTIVGYTTLLLPAYLRKKDITYASIVGVEILVLVLAASGILAVGGH